MVGLNRRRPWRRGGQASPEQLPLRRAEGRLGRQRGSPCAGGAGRAGLLDGRLLAGHGGDHGLAEDGERGRVEPVLGHADLADEGRFEDSAPPLTAAQAVTFADIAAIATGVTGRPIARIAVEDDQFREQLTAVGLPAGAADQLLGSFVASRAGEFKTVDPTLPTHLGRAPIPLRTVLREQLAR